MFDDGECGREPGDPSEITNDKTSQIFCGNQLRSSVDVQDYSFHSVSDFLL